MQTYVAAMQPGWNLGNTFDATGSSETSWGNPAVTQAFLQQIAAQGFKSIRIPVTWMQHTGPAPTYTVDQAWLDRVQQVVDWAQQAGLYVMINMHHDSWEWVNTMPTNHDAVVAEYKAVWTQIAKQFANEPRTLMFESINEPQFANVTDAVGMTLLDELNVDFVNLVRASGGNNATRPLVLPGLNTGSDQVKLDSLHATMTKLNDSNLIATIHYYGFWPFSVNIAGNTKFDSASISDATNAIDAVTRTFSANGIPTIVGEYGLLAFDSNGTAVEHGEMLKFFEYFTEYARQNGVTHMLWDNGQHFDRTGYTWHEPDLYSEIVQSGTGRSTTTDSDLIFLASGSAVADATLTLNLNGNTFVSLKDGTTTLTQGTDYTISGSTLIVKASALTKFATGATGEKTVLYVKANSGPAWAIHVRYYSPSAFASATGTTVAGIAIPTNFNGDLVSTMEAVYASGGIAGPQNWTPYKQYNDTFLPDYGKNTFTVTHNFFAASNSGTINLTLHFWSGRQMKLSVVVDGSGNVTFTSASRLKPTQQTVADSDPTTRITNLSTRGVAEAGDYALIVGFAIDGSGTKKLCLRAVAQTLLNFSLTGVLRKPLLKLYDSSGSVIATAHTQDSYGPLNTLTNTYPLKTEIKAAFDAVSGFGLSDSASGGAPNGLNACGDTAMILTLAPGTYTASVTPDADTPQLATDDAATGTSGKSGLVICELYDADDPSTATARLINISSRGKIETGSRQMIVGFHVDGAGGRRLVIRGVGPSLRDEFGLAAALDATQLQLFDSSHAVIFSNDGWGYASWTDQSETEFGRLSAFPLSPGSADSVILGRLVAGTYSAVIGSPTGSTGLGIAEVYED